MEKNDINFLQIKLNKPAKFQGKIIAYLSMCTGNQNNCNRMVSTTDQIYNKIRKHLSYYTKTIIHLRLSEYC